MKRNIILSAVLGLLFVAIYTVTAVRPVPAKPPVKIKSKQLFTCNAGVTNAHPGSYPGSSVVITWSGVNSPDHYTYGGYYHTSGTFGNTVTYNTQCTIPCHGGGTIVIKAYCADGTIGGFQTITF